MPGAGQRCVLCGSGEISRAIGSERRIVTVTCRDCGAVVRLELDPPDFPGLRGRIELLVEPSHPAGQDE